jgi:hypothetical protein
VARESADTEASIPVHLNQVKTRYAINVDQSRGPQHAEIEQGDEALSACQQLGVTAVFFQRRDRLHDAARSDIRKGRRLHADKVASATISIALMA